MKEPVAVQVPDSEKFSRFIQEMLLDHGYKWRSYGGSMSQDEVRDIYPEYFIVEHQTKVIDTATDHIFDLEIENPTYEKIKRVIEEDWDYFEGDQFPDKTIALYTENDNQKKAYLDVAENFGYDFPFVDLYKKYILLTPTGEVLFFTQEQYEEYKSINGTSEIRLYNEIGLKKLRDIFRN